jgi:hypothetical protein
MAAAAAANFLSFAPNAGAANVPIMSSYFCFHHVALVDKFILHVIELAANQFLIDDPCLQDEVGSSSSFSTSNPNVLCRRNSSLLHLLLRLLSPLADTALLVAV